MDIFTLDQKLSFTNDAVDLHMRVWPTFVNANPHVHTQRILNDFADHQLLAFENDKLVAMANTIALGRSENNKLPAGWSAAIDQGIDDYDNKKKFTTLCALAIVIEPSHLGKGVSSLMLEEMKIMGKSKGYSNLIAPVRPMFKSLYPLIDMQQYMNWKRPDGSAFDPWFRVHQRQGGQPLEVARDSLVIMGSIKDWQEWTQMSFLSSGSYIVKGALSPVEADLDRDIATYSEDNVWYKYSLNTLT